MKNKRKVLLVAPTNTALEQMLTGVIDVLDSESLLIDEHILLRLGNPSTVFADKYPSYCETRGLSHRITRIEEQIKILENARTAKLAYDQLYYLNDLTAKIQNAINLEDNISDTLQRIKIAQKESRSLEQDLIVYNLQHSRMSKTLLSRNVVNVIRKKISAISPDKLQQLKTTIDEISSRKQAVDKHINTLLAVSDESTAELSQTLNEIISTLPEKEKLKPVSEFLNHKQYSSAIDYINNIVSSHTPSVIEFFEKYSEYKHKTIDNIEDEKNALSAELGYLKENNVVSRINKALVVACTIDTLISRLSPDNEIWQEFDSTYATIRPSHIFLDEASFCCLIKSVVLFDFGCPVTLLGDHMQLPPVCEINETTISKNENLHSVSLWNMPSIYANDFFTVI